MSNNIKMMADRSGSSFHWSLQQMLEDAVKNLPEKATRGLVLIVTEHEERTTTDILNAGLSNAEALMILEMAKQKIVGNFIAGEA